MDAGRVNTCKVDRVEMYGLEVDEMLGEIDLRMKKRGNLDEVVKCRHDDDVFNGILCFEDYTRTGFQNPDTREQ